LTLGVGGKEKPSKEDQKGGRRKNAQTEQGHEHYISRKASRDQCGELRERKKSFHREPFEKRYGESLRRCCSLPKEGKGSA